MACPNHILIGVDWLMPTFIIRLLQVKSRQGDWP